MPDGAKKRSRQRGRPRWVCPEPELLGTASDIALAIRWGVNPATVARRRQEAGIPAVNGPLPIEVNIIEARERPTRAWPRPGSIGAAIVPLLGTASDATIADAVGCSRQMVLNVRERLCVERVIERKAPWSCPDPSRLGTAPDLVLAEEWGAMPVEVARARRARGIPAARERDNAARVAQIREWAPTMTDREIGERLGLTTGAVTRFRTRYGIPAGRYQHSAASRDKLAAAQRQRWARAKAAKEPKEA